MTGVPTRRLPTYGAGMVAMAGPGGVEAVGGEAEIINMCGWGFHPGRDTQTNHKLIVCTFQGIDQLSEEGGGDLVHPGFNT